MKQNIDLLISINVHEKPEYLITQIENINNHVTVSKKIILSCNDFMFNELIEKDISETILNPTPINKQRFHGSLTEGIISNMEYSIKEYNFEYFLVMSSRDFFYNKLENINEIKNHEGFQLNTQNKRKDYDVNYWWFPSFRKDVKLFKFLEENNMFFSASAHEGMCFSRETCEYIVDFMNNHPDIKNDLYSVNHCVEEFACQSLAVNSKTGIFYYIGNGCCGEPISSNKLILKRPR
jgi:hypothetical protein